MDKPLMPEFFRKQIASGEIDFDQIMERIIFFEGQGYDTSEYIQFKMKYAEERKQDGKPNLLEKGINFAKAAVRHVAAGRPQASEEDAAARLAICNECPLFEKGECTHCGCIMKRKVTWADSTCPLKPPLWGPVEPVKE